MFGKEKSKKYGNDTKTVVSTLIGKETVFNGDLASGEALRIDGIVRGNCQCEKKLILSADGKVTGDILAESVVISGEVDGNITVSGKLELLSTGKITGDIVAGSLVIDEGASFAGRCTMASPVSSEPAYSTYSEE